VATEERAARELARLLQAAEAGRAPEDSATVGQVLDRYLEVADLGVSTRLTHESYIRRIIRPVLGDVRLRNLGPDTLDALYAHLKRCSRLCGRLPKAEPLPLAATAMLPPMRKARPPNIFFSVSPGSSATSARTRSASHSS
jgi:hypothetical protein